MNITDKKLLKDSNSIPIEGQNIDTETDFLTFKIKNKLIKDATYALRITFTGKIVEELYGFYKSSYFDKEQKTTN